MHDCIMGVEGKLSINDRRVEFTKFENQSVHTLVQDPNAISGFRHELSSRSDYGIKIYRFRAFVEPTITDWESLLPAMGFELSSGVWIPSDHVDSVDVLLDAHTRVFRWEESFCDVAVIRDQKGSLPQRLELQFIALGEDYNYDLSDHSSTFPAFDSPHDAGFIFQQAAMTIRGSAREFDQVNCIIDNNVIARFQNAQVADAACTGGGKVYLATSVPFNATHRDMYEEPAANTAFETGSLSWTRSTRSLLANFYRLHETARPPSIAAKNIEVRLPCFYEAKRGTGSTDYAIKFTLDNTV